LPATEPVLEVEEVLFVEDGLLGLSLELEDLFDERLWPSSLLLRGRLNTIVLILRFRSVRVKVSDFLRILSFYTYFFLCR
jgi:hypothetical protein